MTCPAIEPTAVATASESGLNLSGKSCRLDVFRAFDLLLRAILHSRTNAMIRKLANYRSKRLSNE